MNDESYLYERKKLQKNIIKKIHVYIEKIRNKKEGQIKKKRKERGKKKYHKFV